MSEIDDVLGGRARTTLVVDADAETVADRLGVEHHGRQLTVVDQLETVGVERVAVDDDAVDQRVAQDVRPVRLRGAAVDEHEGQAFVLAHLGDAVEQHPVGGVADGVAQRVLDQPDRADPTATQQPGGRIGPGVAELVGRGEDPFPQLARSAGRVGCRRSTPCCGTLRDVRRSWPASPGHVSHRQPNRPSEACLLRSIQTTVRTMTESIQNQTGSDVRRGERNDAVRRADDACSRPPSSTFWRFAAEQYGIWLDDEEWCELAATRRPPADRPPLLLAPVGSRGPRAAVRRPRSGLTVPPALVRFGHGLRVHAEDGDEGDGAGSRWVSDPLRRRRRTGRGDRRPARRSAR